MRVSLGRMETIFQTMYKSKYPFDRRIDGQVSSPFLLFLWIECKFAQSFLMLMQRGNPGRKPRTKMSINLDPRQSLSPSSFCSDSWLTTELTTNRYRINLFPSNLINLITHVWNNILYYVNFAVYSFFAINSRRKEKIFSDKLNLRERIFIDKIRRVRRKISSIRN